MAHRRAGKTVACINDLIKRAIEENKPQARYAYIAPQYNQSKDIAWLYLLRFAGPIIEHGGDINTSELRITLPNEAQIRLYGAENGERLRGIYLDGVVCDEIADFPPNLWAEVIRPTLSDRKGWAVFIGTPKGHNLFWELYSKAKDDDEWFTAELRADKTSIIDKDELASVRKDLTEDQYEQEYLCSFEAAIRGAYYGRELKRAEADGRICGVPYDPKAEVMTAWDLGISDTTSIWFAQIIGREVHIIDYYENSGVGLDHYVSVIKSRDYNYGTHWLPHDAEVRELGTGNTRVETLASMGLRARIAPKTKIEDGINAARLLLPRCWFDSKKCKQGIESLKQYQQEFNDKSKAFTGRPLHNWASHAADSFRYLSVSLKEAKPNNKPINYPNYGVI